MSQSVMVVLSRLQRRDYYNLLNTANQLHKKVKVSEETIEERLEEATLWAAWHRLNSDEDFRVFSIEDKRKTIAFVYHNLRFLQSNTRRIYSVREMKAVEKQKSTALIKTYTKSEYVPVRQHVIKKVLSARKTPSPVHRPKAVLRDHDPLATPVTLPENHGNGTLGAKGLGLKTPPPDSMSKKASVLRDAHAASLTLPDNCGSGSLGFKGLKGSLWAA